VKKGAPSIALLLGGKDKPAGEGEKEYEGASIEEYRSYLETAFPEDDWSDNKRVTAMKDFVMACMP
jgi:hypothetical protein